MNSFRPKPVILLIIYFPSTIIDLITHHFSFYCMHNYIYYKIFELLSQTGYNEFIMNEIWGFLMAFDGITIANLIYDMNQKIQNGRISKIAQPEPDELLLTIKGSDGQYRLILSASASLPLVYFTNDNKPSPMTAPNFCMLLRKTYCKRTDY